MAPMQMTCSKSAVCVQRNVRMARPASRVHAVTVLAASYPKVKPLEAKKMIDNNNYTVVDVRTPEENAGSSKKYFKNIPVAFDSSSGPKLNPKFKQEITALFPGKTSRVLLACDDGTDRSNFAADVLSEMQYTSVSIVEGGVNALLTVIPLNPQDKAGKPGVNKVKYVYA